MPAQSFNDGFLGNANVPQTGSFGDASAGPMPAKAGNKQAGVQMFDPTGSPRVSVEKLWTDGKSTPTSSAKHWPKGVDSFTDGEV